jgi:NAD-dependent deacetylase
VFLTVGTSSLVYPAAALVMRAKRHGALTIEINPEATPATRVVDVSISAPAEIALPAVSALLP